MIYPDQSNIATQHWGITIFRLHFYYDHIIIMSPLIMKNANSDRKQILYTVKTLDSWTWLKLFRIAYQPFFSDHNSYHYQYHRTKIITEKNLHETTSKEKIIINLWLIIEIIKHKYDWFLPSGAFRVSMTFDTHLSLLVWHDISATFSLVLSFSFSLLTHQIGCRSSVLSFLCSQKCRNVLNAQVKTSRQVATFQLD